MRDGRRKVEDVTILNLEHISGEKYQTILRGFLLHKLSGGRISYEGMMAGEQEIKE